jgi:hypothetical protein
MSMNFSFIRQWKNNNDMDHFIIIMATDKLSLFYQFKVRRLVVEFEAIIPLTRVAGGGFNNQQWVD